MNLLRIQCETCQAWLRVRDTGFVGEVHACPRCGGMVLITAAPLAAPDGPAPTPAEAPEQVGLVLSNTLESVEVPAPETIDAASVAPIEPAEELALPAKTFGWAPVATTAVSLVSTVAIFSVWFSVGGPDASPSQVAQTVKEFPAEGSPGESSPIETSPASESAPASVPVEPLPDETSSEVVAAEPPTVPTITPPEPIETPAAQEPASLPAVRVALALHEEASQSIEPAIEIDPLDFDPTEVELVLRRGPTEDETATPADVSSNPVSMSRRPAAPAGADLDAQLAAAGRQAGIYVRRGPTDASTQPFVGSADKALAYVLPAVALRDIPLDAALQLLGNLAGVPITLEPLALRRSGVAADRRVDVVAEGESLATILRSTLKQVRLDYQTEGPHITVVRAGVGQSNDKPPRTITHRLADLARNDPAGLTTLLRRFVPLNDEFELDNNGEAPLTAELSTQYDLLVFCERLRIARGLPTDSKYPSSLLRPEPALARLAPKLRRRTTFSFVEPTPLAEVIDHWHRVTDVSILVDWRSLADVGLGPQSTVECSATNRPWLAALDGVLGPLGLTWAAVNGETLFITTRDRATPFVTNEFYAVDRSAAKQLIATLTADHPNAVVAYDERSGKLLVRGDAAAHRAAWEATRDR